MQAGLDEFRTVVVCLGRDSDRFHELGADGEPICGAPADREWRPWPVFQARLRWFEPCQREKCCLARDE